jgi:hypothetical protein
MTPIEKAARAIYDLDPIGVRPWEDAPASTREDCLACAKAALSTTLEPGEEEIEAAAMAMWDAWVHVRDVPEVRWDQLTERQRGAWRLAIRSGLKAAALARLQTQK